jgi:hypothetical protein
LIAATTLILRRATTAAATLTKVEKQDQQQQHFLLKVFLEIVRINYSLQLKKMYAFIISFDAKKWSIK